MKKQTKSRLLRILCTALSLCMILALIPTTFAATTEEEVKEEFTVNFKPGAVFSSKAKANTANYESTKEITGSEPWDWEDGTTTGSNFRSYGIQLTSTSVGQYAYVKFYAPSTGTYEVSYTHYVASNGGVGNVYFVKNVEGIDISAVVSDVTYKKFSNVNYYSTKNDDYEEETVPTVKVEKGNEYLIIFECLGAAIDNGNMQMYPKSFGFTYVDPRYNDIKAEYNFVEAVYPDGTARTITYANSGGRVAFDRTNATGNEYDWHNAQAAFGLENDSQYVSYKIRIPAAGLYNFKFEHGIGKNGGTGDLYIIPGNTDFVNWFDADNLVIDDINFYLEGKNLSETEMPETGEFYAPSAGEYYFVLKRDSSSTRNFVWVSKFTLNGSKDSTATTGAPVAGININKTLFEVGDVPESFTITANDSATGASITNPTIQNIRSTDEGVITVDSGNYTVSVVGTGVAEIKADVEGYPASVTLTVNDPDLVQAFKVSTQEGEFESVYKNLRIMQYFTDTDKGTFLTDISVKPKETYTLSLENIGTPEGYKFLYWAKGVTDSKQIIAGETCTVNPSVGEAAYMIAVYEPINGTAADKVEFYNYNGQLLDCEITQDGKMPELPSMTGYGAAKYWALYGSAEAYEGGADAPAVSGNMIFVAQYDALEESITVTVNNGSGDGNYKFGDKVTCVAKGEGEFKWWTKSDINGKIEIVSLNETYTFKAWETCTVTAVYGEKPYAYIGDTKRIILDILDIGGTDDKAIMAEFIGFGSTAVEKGIMLDTKRIAMTSKEENQFTVVNDDNATDIKGYVILSNGTLITDK